jgi:uncharacterized membrane protein YhiD involved in acid resistance
MQRIATINRTIAVWLTSAVGTMWCAYVFAILAVLGFPAPGSSLTAYVQWTSQTFIQLTMLSVIMVGQQVMEARHNDRHAEQMEHHARHAARLDAIEAHLRPAKKKPKKR